MEYAGILAQLASTAHRFLMRLQAPAPQQVSFTLQSTTVVRYIISEPFAMPYSVRSDLCLNGGGLLLPRMSGMQPVELTKFVSMLWRMGAGGSARAGGGKVRGADGGAAGGLHGGVPGPGGQRAKHSLHPPRHPAPPTWPGLCPRPQVRIPLCLCGYTVSLFNLLIYPSAFASVNRPKLVSMSLSPYSLPPVSSAMAKLPASSGSALII